jgi:hypothetical protein
MITSAIRVARSLRVVAVLALLPLLPALVQAQGLPAAKDLIAKWAAATSADAWKSHKSSRMKATFDMPAQGISANLEQVTVYPTQSAMKIDIPGMGEVRQGFNGSVAWSMNPMQGPSIITGKQLEAQKEDNDPANYSRITPAIVSSETVEKTTLNGQECFKVKHTWKSGKTSHDCFSAADGMIVWSQQKQTGPMGEVETTITYSAYKDFGGVKRATTTTFEAMGQQQVITMTGWEWDTVDPKELELPAEIKALVEKKP